MGAQQQMAAPLHAALCQGGQQRGHAGFVESLAPPSGWTSVQLPSQRPAGASMLILQLYILLCILRLLQCCLVNLTCNMARIISCKCIGVHDMCTRGPFIVQSLRTCSDILFQAPYLELHIRGHIQVSALLF